MEMELKPRTQVVLLAGPTASGKSRRALELAERHNGVIINADSMQVYRELRILSARPGARDEMVAAHRLYGHVAAERRYSVGAWLEDVRRELAVTREEERLAIVVGGTGLYFKALTEGISAIPAISQTVRQRVAERVEGLATEDVHSLLMSLDAETAGRIRPTDRSRTVRALEVVEETGVSISEWNRRPNIAAPLANGNLERFVLAPDRGALHLQINARVQAMLDAGAIEEARTLLELRLEPALPAMKAIGVREIRALLEGSLTREDAATAMATETRRYAKRQMTWFRNQMADWTIVPI